MRFGFHLSITGGLKKAPIQAKSLGIDCLQIFSGNPRGWKQRPIQAKEAAEFRAEATAARLEPVVVHAPYLLNPASPDGDLWRRSIGGLTNQLKRAGRLGAAAVVVHPGSRGDKPLDWGLERVCIAVQKALERAGGQAECWLENTAGGGGQIGGELAQLAWMMERLKGTPVGVCLDTAHAWGAGYRLDTARSVKRFLDEVDGVVGLWQVKLWHLNDTQAPPGSHRDKHDHLGQGLIGRKGFKALVRDPRLKRAAAVMETPKDSPKADANNLAFIKGLAGKS